MWLLLRRLHAPDNMPVRQYNLLLIYSLCVASDRQGQAQLSGFVRSVVQRNSQGQPQPRFLVFSLPLNLLRTTGRLESPKELMFELGILISGLIQSLRRYLVAIRCYRKWWPPRQSLALRW